MNTHPGSHLNEISEDECINNIADCINKAIEVTENIIIVLENTSGQGSNMGYKFEHLGKIIEKVKCKKDKLENKNIVGGCKMAGENQILHNFFGNNRQGQKSIWWSTKREKK